MVTATDKSVTFSFTRRPPDGSVVCLMGEELEVVAFPVWCESIDSFVVLYGLRLARFDATCREQHYLSHVIVTIVVAVNFSRLRCRRGRPVCMGDRQRAQADRFTRKVCGCSLACGCVRGLIWSSRIDCLVVCRFHMAVLESCDGDS